MRARHAASPSATSACSTAAGAARRRATPRPGALADRAGRCPAAPAAARRAPAGRCRPRPDRGAVGPAYAGRPARFHAHSEATGQAPHRGARAVHTRAPSSMAATFQRRRVGCGRLASRPRPGRARRRVRVGVRVLGTRDERAPAPAARWCRRPAWAGRTRSRRPRRRCTHRPRAALAAPRRESGHLAVVAVHHRRGGLRAAAARAAGSPAGSRPGPPRRAARPPGRQGSASGASTRRHDGLDPGERASAGP